MFHAAIKIRKSQNKLKLPDGHGNFSEDIEFIGTAALNHFQKLLSSFPENRNFSLHDHVPPCIDDSDNSSMCQLPTEQELHDIVFSIKVDSAPGPDGYTGLFYQKCWKIIKHDLLEAAKTFFRGSSIPKLISSTNLVLLPKVSNASSLDQLRPISLCNVMHKIISKLLNERIKPHLNKLISREQSGFIPGRSIHDNIGLAQDLCQSINRKTFGGNVILKIDMAKAYDRISWNFIIRVLRKFGFSETCCDLIYRCISNCWYSILWEGQSFGYFKSNRGVRQGDPISPTLFILAMEYFSKLLINNFDNGNIGFYFTKPGALQITHLLYADDMMIFSNGSKRNMTKLMQVLDYFCSVSGQAINKDKSTIHFSKHFTAARKKSILAVTNFKQGFFPIKYLGANLYVGRTKISYFAFLEDNVKQRIEGWLKNFLSMAGRSILIQAVLNSLPLHVMSILPVPLTVFKRIQSLMCNFLWDNGRDKKAHWLAWNTVCKPKEEGGLNLRHLSIIRKALLAKLAWKFISNETLWIQFIRSKSSATGYDSFIWKHISPLIPRLRRESSLLIHKGNTTLSHLQEWVGHDIPEQLKDISMRQLYEDDNFLQQLSPLYQSHCQQLLENFDPSSQNCDQILWHQTKIGNFSTKAYYETQRISARPVDILKAIWCKWIPPKISVLCWRIYHHSLPTDDKIISRGISMASKCQCCPNPQVEDMLHIFLHGQTASQLWQKMAATFGLQTPNSLHQIWQDWFLPAKKKTFLQCIIQASAAFVLWELWMYRNKKRMELISRDCFRMIQHHLGEYVYLVPKPADDSLNCHLICNILQIHPCRNNFSGHWISWKPMSWGLTLSVALVDKGHDIHCGYIIRDCSGCFVYAGAFTSLDEDLIPNLLIISAQTEVLQINFQMVQSHHKDMELLSKKKIPWQNIAAWRKLTKDQPQLIFDLIEPAANNVASALAFSNQLEQYPACAYMPLPARRAFIGDWKQLPSFQGNSD